MDRRLLVMGSGGFARETYSWISKNKYHVIGFYSDDVEPMPCMGLTVFSTFTGMAGDEFVVAVGDPSTRQTLWKKALAAGLRPARAMIHPSAVVGIGVDLSLGSVICPNAVLTTNIKMGRGVIVNLGATLGHDCIIGDFVTISPGANVSGNVKIGDRAYLGTNCSVRERGTIGQDSVLGMGAALLHNLPPGQTWAGVPARQIR